MRLAVGSRTDVGRTRKRNEDSYLVSEPLFAVADGMGGHRGGNVASAMAVEALGRAPAVAGGTAAVLAAIADANHAILERGDAERDLQGMGTTVTALLIDGGGGHLAHVGDSRAYLFRDSVLRQLTEDHTVVQEFVRQGRLSPEDAERHPQRSILTRALGVEDDVEIEDLTVDVRDLDRFLLCSDGLTGMLSDDGVAHVLGTTPDPQDAADRLVALANEAGGGDNITAIVIDVHDDDPAAVPDPAASEDPNRTASMAPITAPEGIQGPPSGVHGSPAAPAEPSTRTPAGHPSRRRRLVAAILLALLGLGVIGGFLGARSFLDGQWYVGIDGDRIAVYQGIPASVLGLHLAHLKEVTALGASEALHLASWQGLRDGITAKDEGDADAIVERIRADLCRSPSSTCVPGPVT